MTTTTNSTMRLSNMNTNTVNNPTIKLTAYKSDKQ